MKSAAGESDVIPTRHKLACLPDVHRLLPCSHEAERGVLASFLLDPVIVGRMCRERGLMPAHFHIPAHAGIFAVLQRLHREMQTFDVIMVGQALADEGRLVECGGHAALAELQTLLPTAAYVGHYFEILEEKEAQRALIRLCGDLEERAYVAGDDVPGLLLDARTGIAGIAERKTAAHARELLRQRRFDVETPPPEPVPVWKLDDAVIATPGNLMALQAQAKAGKTAFIGAMIASTLAPLETADTFGLTAGNEAGRALLHFDTEQSPWDHHQGILRALRRAGRVAAPPWFRSYRIADLPLRLRIEMLRQELEWAVRDHGGILAVILDGLADYALDPNDSAEAFALIEELHQLAIRFATVIVCVLHENPGTEIGKTRGHLGSQLERKAETNLRLKKDVEGTTVVFAERARNTYIPREKGRAFAWNHELGMHASVAGQQPTDGRGQFRIVHAADDILHELSPVEGIAPKSLQQRLHDTRGMSRATYFRLIGKLQREQRVEMKNGLWYRRAPQP